MKSRRLTVVCMAAIALVGTPRAWQEIGNLLSAAQQKAQLKFWSMVMRPSEPAEVELIAVAEDVNSAYDVSPCPDQARENLQPVSYREVRGASRAASVPKAHARRQRPEAGSLIARVRKAPTGKWGVERRFREKKDTNFEFKDQDYEFLEVAENLPEPARGAKAAPHTRAIPVDTLKFAQLPSVAPVAAAFSEKEVAYQFKLLKKTLNENRLILRQRGRLPAVRVTTSFPAS